VDNRISEDFIEEVRQRADIVEVISEYVVLKRAGKNYQGLCPFHSEKTPSFNVNPERQMFYCFGCHTGGNVFSFLMKRNNQTFLEALQDVARRVGLELPEKELSQEEQRKEKIHRRWLEIHEVSARYFHEMLCEKPEGDSARKYLAGRGVDQDTIHRFRLGYAPDSWDGLINEMAKQGIAPEELSEAGLSVKKDHGDGRISFYDRFRGRIIFTILDLHGKPIGFGGRVLDDSLPKYLNSPETSFFHKGRNLYGIQVASKGIREAGYSILLEGYMDVIAVQKAGILNALASLGTALTRDQARILKRYSSEVVIGYDSDNAGVQAALRAGEILINEGLKVRVLKLKDAKDPDEYLREHSKEDFLQEVKSSLSYVEFKYDVLVSEAYPKLLRQGRIDQRMAPDILRTGSAAEREG
jgi:DNA primase